MTIIELNKIFGKKLNFDRGATGDISVSVLHLVGHDHITVIRVREETKISCNFMHTVKTEDNWFTDKTLAIKHIRSLFRCSVDNLFGRMQKEAGEGITYTEYMKDTSNLHHSYHLQFGTKNTIVSILEEVGMKALRDSEDGHLNDVKIPFNHMGSGGSWWWATLDYNEGLLKEKESTSHQSARTCIAKSVARFLLQVDNATS